MVDFHTHILPAIDDGAETTEQAVLMLKKLKAVGFTDVVLTPHYYSNKEPLKDFLSSRTKATRELLAALEGEDCPELHLAAEVYISPILFNNQILTPLTVNGEGKFMLVELPYDDRLTQSVINLLERLTYARSITPILAHIERYPFLLEEKNLLRLLDMGCTAQVNFNSFLSLGKRLKLKKYIKKGYISAFGTDAHKADGAELELSKVFAYLNVEFGEKFLKEISAYTKETIL